MSKRTQRVVLNWNHPLSLKKWVSRDTVSGLPLFYFFLNDLAKILDEDCTFVQFSDDTFSFTSIIDKILSKTYLGHITSHKK